MTERGSQEDPAEVTVRFPAALLERIDAARAGEDATRSEFVARALRRLEDRD